MSEDLISRQSRRLGRFSYISLGSTTLAQLKRSRFIRARLMVDEEARKPDGIVFLPLGGIKAVVEVKPTRELAGSKLKNVIGKYAPIARAVCHTLIITDGQERTFWINAHTERPVRDERGEEVRVRFNLKAIDGSTLSREDEAALVALVEKCDYSLTPANDQFSAPKVIDPSGLSQSVWQKIWINTGKEPEKCLYNVVEILVFKFLSDLGVLTGNHAFSRIVELLADEGEEEALNHYARVSRDRIRTLFPAGRDGTTIINGTIFVNEEGLPNSAQEGLFGEVIRAFQDFDDQHGSLRYIDRQFKTRLYETFLRQQAGIRSLGQYFTPRNVVQAIVRMAEVARLRSGEALCDPFCGVGGFLLEAIAESPGLMRQYRPTRGRVRPEVTIRGYDKGSDEKEDERTIILAKANMLVYLSDLLSEYHSPEYLREFSEHAFNEVFHLLRSNLGTYALVDEREKYDLILTNPPYVTQGAASIRAAIEVANLTAHYGQGGRGTESLAMQWIVSHLKHGGRAFVVVPDGLLNQTAMLDYLKTECQIMAIAALPSRTFYSTPKKTYILSLQKREEHARAQTHPVFTYLVSEIGESRDTRRVEIKQNDLVPMSSEYRLFQVDPDAYASSDPRVKIVPWNDFSKMGNWLVDRLWSHEEKVALGIAEEIVEVDAEGLREMIVNARRALANLEAALAP